jgi:hypothetical protein
MIVMLLKKFFIRILTKRGAKMNYKIKFEYNYQLIAHYKMNFKNIFKLIKIFMKCKNFKGIEHIFIRKLNYNGKECIEIMAYYENEVTK